MTKKQAREAISAKWGQIPGWLKQWGAFITGMFGAAAVLSGWYDFPGRLTGVEAYNLRQDTVIGMQGAAIQRLEVRAAQSDANWDYATCLLEHIAEVDGAPTPIQCGNARTRAGR